MALPGSQQRCAWPETPVPGVTTQPVPEDSALGLVGGAPPRMTALLGCRQCSACLPTALAPPAPAAALMPSVSCTVPALCVVLPSGMALTQDPVTLVPKLRHILGSLLPQETPHPKPCSSPGTQCPHSLRPKAASAHIPTPRAF